MRRPSLDLIGCLLVACLFTDIALALPEDRQQPINLKSDTARFDQNTGISEYEGHVEVSQGSMYLAAEKATVYLQGGTLQRVVATGSPTNFRYKPSADKEQINGIGNRVEYDVGTAKVTVTGDARFTQGGDVFTGEFVEFDLTTDVVSAKGDKTKGKDDGRINIILQPRATDAAAKPTSKK